MGLFWTTLQVLLVLSVCYAQRSIPKTAKAFCVKKPDGQQFTMRFNLLLDATHPDGELIPILTGSEMRKSDGCPFTITGDLYVATFDYDIDLNSLTDDANKCGVVRGIDVNGMSTYTWRIAFTETKNIIGNKLMYDDLDRIYTFTCNEVDLTEVELYTSILVTTPNLNQNLPITDLDVAFRVYKQVTPVASSGGNYEVVNSGVSVSAGNWIYLELALSLPADFTLSTHPHGIYGYNTIVSGVSTFTDYLRMFDAVTGCTSQASATVDVMPFNPTSFVRDTTKTTVGANGRWVLKTGPFRALLFEGSDTMNFKTNFGLCFGNVDTNGRCVQSCLAKRRKRSLREDEEVATQIRVVPGDEKYHVGKTQDSTESSNMTALIIGLVIVGVFTLLTSILVTVACLMRRRRGKQQENRYNNFSNPPSVVPTEKN